MQRTVDRILRSRERARESASVQWRMTARGIGLCTFPRCPASSHGMKKPPAAWPPGASRKPTLIRRSGQEVPLDAEHHAEDVLVVDGVDTGRTSAVRREGGGALVGRVEMRPQQVNADMGTGRGFPRGARADLPEAEVRIAVRHAG